MLPSPKLKIIQELIANSAREELIWLNGYLAGILAQNTILETSPPAQPVPHTQVAKSVAHKITIAYGTETGNSKKLAFDFAGLAKMSGIQTKLVSLDQYRLNDLGKEEYFFTVISTQGEGEPPAAAKKFYDHVHQNGFKLNRMKFGVLALGDTAYPLFCKAGEDIDAQLQRLGAERLVQLQRCDTNYESEASEWFSQVLQKIKHEDSDLHWVPSPLVRKPSTRKAYQGSILANINLNDRGSEKQTRHIEIAAEAIDYQPGDSIGIVPGNPSSIVESILEITRSDRTKLIHHRGEDIALDEFLSKRVNIVFLPERVVKKYAAIVQQEIPETKIGLLDLLKIYPVKDSAQFEEALLALEPIAPRLYSISSSPEAHPGEIHITVAKDSFTINQEVKHGLCSEALSQLALNDSLDFYIHRNALFKLPPPDKDIIMIGPGTGLAPFRSFLAEREATGAGGKNWLFFGDQHFRTDFLYQTELQSWLQTGVLTKLEVAFSRDQQEKVYVQHKMLKYGSELYDWLQQGAYFYLCGAKEPMGSDVEKTLLEIIQVSGNKKLPEAIAYLDELKEAGRYMKDVY
jgi:sulfite reductase (NADPH) flavoprotein alpha-component